MTLPHTLVCTMLAALAVGVASATAATAPRPNIVFILADDLGFNDVNAFAAHLTGESPADMFYETPHLDRLTREGTAFSQAYAAQLCSPTRAGLLTGKIAARIGVTTATPATVRTFFNRGLEPPPGYRAHDAIYWGDSIAIPQALLNGSTLEALPAGQPLDGGLDEMTLAEALPGYRSAFIGKWHLGGHGAAGWQPQDQGFEAIAYSDEGASPYFNWRGTWADGRKPFPHALRAERQGGLPGPETDDTYLTDSLTTVAVRYLEAQAAAPTAARFFLYLCHFAVHLPPQAKPEDIAHFAAKPTKGWHGQDNATYAAMVKSLDDSVGRILDTLDRTSLSENTVFVFMSDNGGVTYSKPPATSNAPLKGGKAMLFEGGIRVPLIVRRPGHIPSGQWSNVPVDYADLFPTLLDLAGADPAPHYATIDGRSLAPLLADPANRENGYTRDTHYWHYPFNVGVRHPDDGFPLTPHSAIRVGDDKLIFDWSGELRLYDLSTDWREEHDLAATRPERARELFIKLNDWLDAEVAAKYTPLLNPDYDPALEARSRPFIDLRRQLLGPDRSIRPAASDARIEVLSGLDR